MSVANRVYGISGIPLAPDVQLKTGTLPFAPNMPVRVEISKLFPSDDPFTKKQWTLFVKALHKFKCMPVDDKLSYFQVAGIHGYPETSWDGADPPPEEPKNPDDLPPGANSNGGYCHHNMITFPTWHRPYMLLFEKLLWTNMYMVIEEWKKDKSISFDEAEWKRAADLWRLPYWDWASKNNGKFSLPVIFTVDTVKIYPPTSAKEEDHENPLWGFVNPEKDADNKPRQFGDMPEGKKQWNINDDVNKKPTLPWSKCSGVSRYGLKYADSSKEDIIGYAGVNNWETVNTQLDAFSWYDPFNDEREWNKKAPGTLADAVNRMFSPEYSDTWGTFSTTKWWAESEQDTSTGYLSLEYIHNNVHVVSGGGDFNQGVGHMSDVPVAAFDPLFWMHHCNIDRLLAMWQVLNWNVWWNKPEPEHKEQNIVDPTPWDPLKPFHNVEGGDPLHDFWTSQMVRDWTKLNYQYDTLRPQQGAVRADGTLNEEKYKQDLFHSIQATYPSTLDFVRKILADDSIKNEDFFGEHIGDKLTDPKERYWDDYLINVQYDRYALKGRSYSIQFFLGGEPGDRETCYRKGSLIGQVYSLGGLRVGSDGGGCGNCGNQQQNGVLSGAQVPITIPIMLQAIQPGFKYIKSARQVHVKTYLEKHLFWKFVEIGGVERPASEFPRTKICVFIGKGRGIPGPDAEGPHPAPFYEAYHPVYRPTESKEGGLKRHDKILGEGNSDNWEFRGLE